MAKPKQIGTCKLCGASGVELQDSHVIPRWAYRHIRGAPGTGNPEPVRVDGPTQTAMQISAQVSERMLCTGCERVFGLLENYVKSLAYSDGMSAVPIIARLGPIRGRLDGRVGRELGSVDGRKLFDFALSVVWRAHVCTLPATADCGLGSFADHIRDYLRGARQAPPKHTTLQIHALGVSNAKAAGVAGAFSLPQSERLLDGRNPYTVHQFLLCGLRFVIITGRRQPNAAREVCAGTGRMPTVWVATREQFLQTMAELIATATPVGKLRARSPQ